MSQDPTNYGDTPEPDLIVAHPRHEVIQHVAQTETISLIDAETGSSAVQEADNPASVANIFSRDAEDAL
ncbi:hypothetical protein [Jonesia quinghaiensis]|uniref:hypothetical protein n=1 Tax=Jonesia quinghaiensis TaxID=262806 RepID=UPI0004195608|nr:hypothetical protein [Jonesia quinghaiensis]